MRPHPSITSFAATLRSRPRLHGLQFRRQVIHEGTSLVAISPQTAPNSRRSQRENKLGFPILSDTKSEVADAFGIRFALPDYRIEVYKAFKNDLPTINADPAWVLPMPARYVIGTDGVIAYAEVNPD
ncbi:MAG TPA: redoxin domain-containing protein [Dongiaceae bacterium]